MKATHGPGPFSPWQRTLLTALSLSVGWGIRGNFGHEAGAMLPGALAAMAVVLLSGREDWHRRIAFFAFFGALGWSFGGSISYMQVIAYTHSGHSLSVWYGFACLFVIGFLWAAMGGAGTALPALLDRERLTEFFAPLSAVFGAWWLQSLLISALETHSPEFRQESPLYWYDTDWLGVLVAIGAVLLLALCRRRLDRASALILHMGIGWWSAFLLLVVGLGWRMTPPRGDNWAGCVGMVGGMLLYFLRNGLAGAALASLVSGFVGGFAFATATMLKLVEVTSGLDTNWHSVLEQRPGFLNGLGIALAMGLLIPRARRISDDPPVRPWCEQYAVAWVLLLLTYCNVRKNVDEWIKKGAVPALMHGIPAAWWFNASYGLLAVLVLSVLVRHARRPLALLPATWLGRGQMLYLLLLWWMVVGNFERALVGFTAQRLVTEGVLHVNAVLCSLLVLLAPRRAVPAPDVPPDFRPWVRRVAAVGTAALLLCATADWGIVRAIWGDRFAGYASLHIRFGPRATATTAKPRAGQPHP